MKNISRNNTRLHRKRRIRAKIFGTSTKPRLSIYRSNMAIYAQLIDDESGKTIACADSRKVKGKKFDKDCAAEVGKIIAEKAIKLKIESVVFDRGGYKYHGKVKELADGARKGGLVF